MDNEAHIIDALTSLIEVNNKRMKFYQFLVGKMKHTELRSLFSHYADQSREFAYTLSTWRSAYGGFNLSNEEGGSLWTRVTSWLEHWLRKKVASQCEEMEHDILKAYRKVMQMPFIPADTAAEIAHHSRAFEEALRKLKTLREQGSNVSVREELVHTIM